MTLVLALTSCGDSDDETTIVETASTASTTPDTSTTESLSTTASDDTSATSGSTSTTVGTCSAAGLTEPGSQAGLPAPVAERRTAILAAALACDIEGLVSLTGPEFTASFGGDDPATLWTAGEDAGEEPLRFLVDVLRIDYRVIDVETGGDLYVWPAAFAYDSWDDVPEDDRLALLNLYAESDLQDFALFGGYIGYRVGIDEDGTWLFFVAGD